MASGLIALLDDIASIADDVATLTLAATKKTTGIVTDDMAVTAEQTLGIAREREIPVVFKVAVGSMRNKALILAPGALLLNAVAPWSISPILMAGGTFLAYEGVEKILHRFRPHGHDDEDHDGAYDDDESPVDPATFEQTRVSGAIRTDLILSGEIIALTLAEVATRPLLTQVIVLYGVSVILTIGVYGVVGLLVKVDDLGEALIRGGGRWATVGRPILAAAPKLLHAISWIGTIAMLMVGGHILVEGIPPIEHAVHGAIHDLSPALAWLVNLAADIGVGGVVGAIVVGVMWTGIPQRAWALVPRFGR